MGRKTACEMSRDSLFLLDGDMPAELAEHLDTCGDCRREYESILKMRRLVKESAPYTPDMKDAVIGRIKTENIVIREKKPSRRRIPLGTLAAAAACLVIYISVYGSGLFDNIFKSSDNFAECEVADECAVEDTDGADFTDSVGASYKYKANGTQSADPEAFGSEAKEKTETVLFSDKKQLLGVLDEKGDADAEAPANTVKFSVTDNTEEFELNTEIYDITNSASGNILAEGSTATEEARKKSLFESFSEQYPERIPYEIYEQVGEDVFAEFVRTLTDPETQYTEEALLAFAAEYDNKN